MKKLFVFSVALTAILSLSSCNKETVDSATVLPEGKVVSFTLAVPGEQDNPEGDVKLSFGEKEEDKIHMTWNAGDSFALITRLADTEYTYNSGDKKVEPSAAVTDCGPFTTTQDGVSTATFTGTIPAGAPDQNGMAIFPASAYAAGSGHIQYSSSKFLIGFNAALPSEQDGTGAKYLVATAKLKDGNLGKFTFPFGMVKINVPAGLGITKISLSEPVGTAKPLCANDVHLYYYFTQAGCSLATTGDKVYSINVARGGEEISGDVYFVTRNLDVGVTLTLSFFKGTQMSKPMRATSKALSGGQMIDYGTVTPVFPEQTVIEFDREALKTAKQQFVPKNPTDANEVFPYTAKSESITLSGASSATSFYHLSNVAGGSSSSFTELNYQWFNQEHTYTCGGYDWVFGSTKEFTSLTNVTEFGADANKGMYYYTSNGGYYLRMDPGAYLKTPVISGKRLVGIGISIVNSKNTIWWRLSKTAAAETADLLLNDNDIKMNKDSGLLYFYLDGTEKDTSYYFISNGGLQPVKIILYYQ